MATEQVTSGPQTADTEGQGKVQEVASQAIEKAQEKAHGMKGQISAKARIEVDARSTQLGEQVTSVVQALRGTGEQLQGERNEAGGKAVQAVADRAERLGSYLRDSDTDRFIGDLESFGRRKPWAAAGIGVAAGFTVSRFLKASAANRYEASRQGHLDSDTRPARAGYDEPLSPDDASAPASGGGRL